MPSKSNPFDEIQRMFDRLSGQFDDIDNWGSFEAAMKSGLNVDVAEYEEEFVVTADLPGVEKNNIDIELSEDRLRISADREEETEEKAEPNRYIRQERRRQSVSRSLTLPEPIDEESVSATFQHGVLTVTLPKEADMDAHSIDIE